MSETKDIRIAVRERYGALAAGTGRSCCGGGTATLSAIGYTPEQARAVPEGADLGLGCGNPLAHAGLLPGETVLDLGAGAGVDVFLAAREVGPTGRAIGVDMTPAMVERARANAAAGSHANVEFRLGEIEHLPAADASVDAIISNCVVNLSPEKERVFREAYRVLRPGGRMLVSDLVLVGPLPESIRSSVEAYVGCVAGASLKEDYLRLIRQAGFRDVEVVQEGRYSAGGTPAAGATDWDRALNSVVSIQVRARK